MSTHNLVCLWLVSRSDEEGGIRLVYGLIPLFLLALLKCVRGVRTKDLPRGKSRTPQPTYIIYGVIFNILPPTAPPSPQHDMT